MGSESFAGFYLLYWFGISFLIGIWGDKREIGFWKAMIVSVLLSPFIGAICTFATQPKTTVQPMILPNKAVALRDLENQLESGAITYEEFQERKSAIEQKWLHGEYI
jgi:hypothetical protein